MRNCVILGSGRSGTSMLAGALHAAGYHLGDELLPASVSNPKGYFEDRAVNELNEDLLLQVAPLRPTGRRSALFPFRLAYGHRWLAVIDPAARMRAAPALALRMRELIRRRPFCLKDPRFCYTLDLWRPALGDAAYICVFREPGRTASSLMTAAREERRYLAEARVTRRRALAVWTAMYQHVLDKHARSGDWEFVHYEQFLSGSAITRLRTLLDAHVDAGFADRKLKRSTDSCALPRRTASLYERLCELAGFDGEAPTDGR